MIYFMLYVLGGMIVALIAGQSHKTFGNAFPFVIAWPLLFILLMIMSPFLFAHWLGERL